MRIWYKIDGHTTRTDKISAYQHVVIVEGLADVHKFCQIDVTFQYNVVGVAVFDFRESDFHDLDVRRFKATFNDFPNLCLCKFFAIHNPYFYCNNAVFSRLFYIFAPSLINTLMSLLVRVHVHDYKDDSQRDQRSNDLLSFCRILNIPTPKEANLPGHNTFEIDVSSMSERRLLRILRAFWAMESLNPHFSVLLRDTDSEPEFF